MKKILKLENQVTNLALSKKLKKLGVEQESLYHWNKGIDGKYFLSFNPQGLKNSSFISSFTVAELGKILPREVKTARGWEHLYFVADVYVTSKTKRPVFRVYIEKINEMHWMRSFHKEANTEANVRAKMLIYLIENNLLNQA